MKKKVGIITLFGYHNYGNRLQNYAVQEVLEELGFETITIKSQTSLGTEKMSPFQSICANKNNIMKKLLFRIKKIKNKKITAIRLEKFEKFSKKYIKETSNYISNNNIPKQLENEYDFFITGSDQVWNPLQRGTDIEFLMFAPTKKRISFSASFGTSFIPQERKEFYTKALNEMSSISVRETEGMEIVKDLTKRTDIVVLVDPTMLLSKNKWLEIVTDSIKKPFKYILVYFLGDKSSAYSKTINTISKKYDCEIIELLNPQFKDYYTSDPAEFVELINNATLICTDSFHGAVFSIILNKNFLVFDRVQDKEPSMNSRIKTLLKTFNLNDRYWSENYNIDTVFNQISYAEVNVIIEHERQKAKQFLTTSLV